MFSLSFLYHCGFCITGFGLFPRVLEGLGSSGRLVGTISTSAGTYKCPWSRVMTKNPGGELFRPGYCILTLTTNLHGSL